MHPQVPPDFFSIINATRLHQQRNVFIKFTGAIEVFRNAGARKFVENLPDDTCGGRAWSNFDKMCARVEQSEAETEVLLELLGEPDASVPLDADVEAELRAMKEAASHVAC